MRMAQLAIVVGCLLGGSGCIGNLFGDSNVAGGGNNSPNTTAGSNGDINGNGTGGPSSQTATLSGGNAGEPNVPFYALSANVYVGKVKALLTGQSATADEVAQVTRDPDALITLVQQWVSTPEYAAIMRTFYGDAFQQSALQIGDLTVGGTGLDEFGAPGTLLYQNILESFPLTVENLVKQGLPFTSTVTTQQFMMTVPLMAFYAAADNFYVDDAGHRHDIFPNTFPLTFQHAGGPIPIAQSIDPNNPNYMVWYDGNLPTTSTRPGCNSTDPQAVNDTPEHPHRARRSMAYQLFAALIGSPLVITPDTEEYGCPIPTASQNSPYITTADYSQWRMVTIRRPKPGEATTKFYDLNTLRTTNELVLNTPRIGFFTTASFLAQWATNASNQYRVTMNQTLITGLGAAVDGTDPTLPLSEAALDANHASNPACFQCHRTLDPMRQFFRQAYNLSFASQVDPNQINLPGMFAFNGVSIAGTNINDLATSMATSSKFATAWAQKVCTHFNSAPCDVNDPEFKRVEAVFVSSNYSFPTLVTTLATSPLVTYAAPTATNTHQTAVYSIARRDQFCANLSSRVGITDVCGLLPGAAPSNGFLRQVQNIAQGLPADAYSRGAVEPVLVTQPGLFFRAGTENLCLALAGAVVDAGSTSKYSSADVDAAVADFVANIMGLTGAQAQAASNLLTQHYQQALATKVGATAALRSTFALACESPSSVHFGL